MTIFLKIIILIIIFLAILGSLIIVSLLFYRVFFKISTCIKTPNGISSLEHVTLGNLKQWIFIRSENKNNPILIFLHGGPGEPVMGMPSSRKLDSKLIKHYTVVHWDQRGGGKSYNENTSIDSMSIDSLVEDCNELIDYLRKRFEKQKVFIVAHSSGSTIGIKTAYKYPEKIYAYVGVAQIINDYEQHKISYNYLIEEAKKNGNLKREVAIKKIGPPPYETPEKMFNKARYIVLDGKFIKNKLVKRMLGIVLDYFTSPEYSFVEAFNSARGRGLHFTTNARWQEIKKINYNNEIKSIDVPVYFFVGKYDMIAPAILVENFYKQLNAKKSKRFIVFENSAHFPLLEENEKYCDLLINTVLKENINN